MAGGVAKAPKVRSRRDGAAIPLDETDKRLMNLLQSRFPLAAEPYAALAPEADLGVDELMERTSRSASRAFAGSIWYPRRSPNSGVDSAASRNGP